MSEAELIDWATRVGNGVLATGLTEISSWPIQDKIDMGWYDNPAVKILYSLTSAGAFAARTNASGKLTEANSTAIYGSALAIARLTAAPSVSDASILSYSAAQTYVRRIAVVPFASNVGGTLDADVDLSGTVGAKTGFYMVIDEIFFMSLDVGGASTPTFVFSTTTHDAFRTHGALTVTGDNQINKQLESVPIYYEDDDDEVVYLDTTTSDLGASKNWLCVCKFHFET